jgi:ABC-type lipoprotein export system ATPase subunit
MKRQNASSLGATIIKHGGNFLKQFCLLKYEDPEVSIPLFDENLSGRGPKVSVVIGPNGSGKSRMLSRIVDELCFLDTLRNSTDSTRARFRPASESAKIEYRIGDANCVIDRNGRDLICTLNGMPSTLLELPFPTRVATVAHLPSDKFRFLKSEKSSFYRYLGLRQATNLTTTGALETKVIQSLLLGLTQKGFAQRLEAWLSLAGMTSDTAIKITLANSDLLNTNFEGFEIAALHAARRRAGPARADMFGESEEWRRDLEKIWLLFSQLHHSKWSYENHNPSLILELTPLFSDPDSARVWIDGIDAARRRRLFEETSLLIGKSGGRYRFSDLSSGEQQLVGTNARLLAELESNSLVFIDEPEISLHPEWQIKYIPTLLKSLAAIPSTHVVIATHSHFMVSDLDSDNSSLIMSSNLDGPKFQLFDGEVYGRSPENILYRVFGVATSGNSYVEGDLHSALRMLSSAESLDLVELEAINRRLEKVRGKDNTALNVILGKIAAVLALESD